MKYLVIFVSIFMAISANSESFRLNAEVAGIYIQDLASGEEKDFFTLKGGASAGSCFKYSDGNTAVFLNEGEDGKRMLSLVLAAKMAGKPVRVQLSEGHTSISNNTYCKALWVAIPN